MDEYRKELASVKDEIMRTEVQIRNLTKRHSNLLQKKEELEYLITECKVKAEDEGKVWDDTNFPWSDKLQNRMSSVFHIEKLRPLQLETMNVTMSGKDCFLIMPTGGGKSLCFQLPALISKGITLVVSPLISLIEDQLVSLEMHGVEACTLNSATGKDETNRIMNDMLDPNASLRLLYVTPEKLAKSKRFMAKLEKMHKVGRFPRLVIDEVHCCSQWGHDFRPDYKFLGIMKTQFPDVPILGLTATASSKVITDVKKILNLPHSYIFRASFNRPNLFYEVREKPVAAKDVLNEISNLIQGKFRGKSGIVYCFSRKESEDVTVGLRELGVRCGCYHADLDNMDRKRTHKAWLSNKIQVIVATVAFGMGIDKPDVRFVIHHSLSKSMENLYQEAGRAGRDDKFSNCIIYYRLRDVMRQSTMVFSEQKGIENLYGLMDYCSDIERCRRTMIANHFGESSGPIDCNKMCDICKSKSFYVFREKNVSSQCLDILKLVTHGVRIDKKLTLNKLLDAWFGKGPPGSRLKEVKPPNLTMETCERIVATMLMRGQLKEEFHFTPYSTISYLIAGPMASILKAGQEFLMKFRVRKAPSSSASLSVDDSKAKSESKKSITLLESDEENGEINAPPLQKEHSRKKRSAPIIIEEDSDSDESSSFSLKKIKV